MKLKITNEQAKRLSLINEQLDDIIKFEDLCKKQMEEVNKIFVQITNMYVIELIEQGGDNTLKNYYNTLDKIDTTLYNQSNRLSNTISTMEDEDEMDRLQDRVDSAYFPILKKVNALHKLIDSLRAVSDLSDSGEDSMLDIFKDIKSMNI